MQRVGVNGDIKDGNQRNEKIQVPQARALRAHKGCEIAALHVDIAIYLQGRERVGEAADAVLAGAAAAAAAAALRLPHGIEVESIGNLGDLGLGIRVCDGVVSVDRGHNTQGPVALACRASTPSAFEKITCLFCLG